MSLEERLAQLEQIFAGAQEASTQTATQYDAWRSEFGATPQTLREPLVGGRSVAPYLTSATGKLLFSDGVIADPVSGQVEFGGAATDPDIAGSSAWLISVQNKGDEWANRWRETLWDQGFVGAGLLQSEKGGMAQDLIDALKEYHRLRYVSGGKAIPLAPVDQMTRETMREQVDFVALKDRIKTWGEVPFGRDLDPKTADFFAEQTIKEMTQLSRKRPTWTLEQVESGADLRVQKEFVKEPDVREGLKEAKRIEERTGLRERLETAAQVFGSI